MNKVWTCSKCGYTWFTPQHVEELDDSYDCECLEDEKPDWVVEIPRLSLVK